MAADQCARLRRRDLRRADHEHNRRRKGDDGERIRRRHGHPLHDTDGQRHPEAGSSARQGVSPQ